MQPVLKISPVLDRAMTQLHHNNLRNRGLRQHRDVATWPRINILDAGERIEVHALLPGVEHEDLTINANRELLTLQGRRELTFSKGDKVHYQGRASQRFSRSLRLPVEIDPEKVEATLKDGVLRVVMEKMPNHQPRTLEIKVQ